MKTWRLSSKQEQRFKQGHPWVFSNELQESPKGTGVGEVVKLAYASGDFAGIGIANPHSLICFREISRSQEPDPLSESEIRRKVKAALETRLRFYSSGESFRVLFAESDGFPGMILDRYAVTGGNKQILVVQLQAVSAEAVWKAAGKAIVEDIFPQLGTTCIVRRDSNSRLKDGLEKREPEIIGSMSEQQLARISVHVDGVDIFGNFLGGQKTGLFLDQSLNRRLVAQFIPAAPSSSKDFHILDLFSYVGQWGVSLSLESRKKGWKPKVHFADSSKDALSFAESNAAHYQIPNQIQKVDLLEHLPPAEGIQGYDVVICDPPALVKSRKDISAAKQAYVGLNQRAMKLVKPGGVFVTCSCSQLISDPDFTEILSRAERRAGQQFQWVLVGQQAPDHPVLSRFPEGKYLKAWIGIRI